MTLTLDFQGQICHILGMGRSIDLEWKRCELDTMLDAQWACSRATVHGKYIDQVMGRYETLTVSNLVGPWMGYWFTDLRARGVVVLWMHCFIYIVWPMFQILSKSFTVYLADDTNIFDTDNDPKASINHVNAELHNVMN